MSTPFNPVQWIFAGAGDVPGLGGIAAAAAPQATNATQSAQSSALPNWLQSLGADVASGLETGFVAILKDMWKVIVGPMFIGIGVFIAMFTLSRYFQGDIAGLASVITSVVK
jgi:hypothetical protein